jgi:threonine/homoserine efflux transporter RhtA
MRLIPFGTVLLFIAAIGQLLTIDVFADGGNRSRGVVWTIIALAAAGQWLHFRTRRDRETADAMGMMVATLTAVLARVLTS